MTGNGGNKNYDSRATSNGIMWVNPFSQNLKFRREDKIILCRLSIKINIYHPSLIAFCKYFPNA